jgi:hypothetical protein
MALNLKRCQGGKIITAGIIAIVSLDPCTPMNPVCGVTLTVKDKDNNLVSYHFDKAWRDTYKPFENGGYLLDIDGVKSYLSAEDFAAKYEKIVMYNGYIPSVVEDVWEI